MKVHIASDHAGIDLKIKIIEHLKSIGCEVLDHGPFNKDSVDYPDYANKVCTQIKTETNQTHLSEFGILICGSGQGMALRANKFSHIRAALVYNNEIAQLSREHNDANIICIGARFCNEILAINWVHIFKETAFAQGRHQTRVAKLSTPTS